MTLLISAASVIRGFRIVATVTNLQQRIAACGRDAGRSRHLRIAQQTESPAISAAEALGKGWRFFTPYALAQSSPVLRQSFIASMISSARFSNECQT
jgi:hypothetical protein